MRLRKFEIRMSVTKNLYDRIFQEAKYRDTKMANIAREKLAKHFFQHEISSDPLEETNIQLEDRLNKIIQTQLTRTEKRLFSAISKAEKQFELIQEQMKFFAVMIGQFYLDLMKFIPDVPEELILAAIATAQKRHADWLKTIEKILKG